MDGVNGDLSLNVSSIIIQKTSLNLETLIRALTTLDKILSNSVRPEYVISDNVEDTIIISHLFSTKLGDGVFTGNEYAWNTFNSFIMSKEKLRFDISTLNNYCNNKKLLNVIFDDIVYMTGDIDTYDDLIVNKNQNLLKAGILKLFQNVTTLQMWCDEYAVSLESVLTLIKGTQIKVVEIHSSDMWLPLVTSSKSYDEIKSEYEKANFDMEIDDWAEESVIITAKDLSYNSRLIAFR